MMPEEERRDRKIPENWFQEYVKKACDGIYLVYLKGSCIYEELDILTLSSCFVLVRARAIFIESVLLVNLRLLGCWR